MNPWVVVLRALPVTFLVYLSSTALAAVFALPTGLELGRIPSWAPGEGAARVAALESLLSIAPALRAQALSLMLAALAYALLSPWLQMAWFAALSAPRSPGAALAEGAQLTFRAYRTTLLVGFGCVLMLLPCVALVWLTRSWLASRANVRVQDLATLLALLPGVLLLCVSCAWHDLARARCLSSGAFRSSLWSFRDALSSLTLARYALWSGLGLALSLAVQLGSLRLEGPGYLNLLVLLAMVQSAALARSMLRSRWLTEALLCADARNRASPTRKGSR